MDFWGGLASGYSQGKRLTTNNRDKELGEKLAELIEKYSTATEASSAAMQNEEIRAMAQRREKSEPQQQQQGSEGGGGGVGTAIAQKYMGGKSGTAATSGTTSASGTAGGGSAAGSSGMGAWGVGGLVAAAIGAQHAMSNDTNRSFDGVKTNDAFSGHFATEPWMAWGFDKLGAEQATPGEKYDAAMKNKDYTQAGLNSMAATRQWSDPGKEFLGGIVESKVGSSASDTLDPTRVTTRHVEKYGKHPKAFIKDKGKYLDPARALRGLFRK